MIETIRGLAALSVCLFHFTIGSIHFVGSSSIYQLVASKGWLGVQAFFVVSGFIIPYSLIKSKYQIKHFFQFFAKRCVRIEPPYLLSVLVIVLLSWLSTLSSVYNGQPFQFEIGRILAHIAYLPEHLGYKWYTPVYWSLEAEFHYYILIGLALPFLWKNNISLLIGFAAGLIASFFIPLAVFSYMPLFIMGIAVCAYKTEKINQVVLWIVLIACVATGILRDQPIVMSVVGVVTALLICYVEFRSRITDFLGKISFSLYLLHAPVGGRVINLGGRYADTDWKVWLVVILALTVSIVVAWLFYQLIEYPSQRWSKQIKYSV